MHGVFIRACSYERSLNSYDKLCASSFAPRFLVVLRGIQSQRVPPLNGRLYWQTLTIQMVCLKQFVELLHSDKICETHKKAGDQLLLYVASTTDLGPAHPLRSGRRLSVYLDASSATWDHGRKNICGESFFFGKVIFPGSESHNCL